MLLLVGLGSGALDPFGDAEVEEPHPILGWFTLCNAFVKSGKIERKRENAKLCDRRELLGTGHPRRNEAFM